MHQMNEEDQRRMGGNEALFREANEAIDRGLWLELKSAVVRFRCECARLCGSAVEVTLREYERVREHPRRFILLDGHEVTDVEAVVERRPAYVVVEKRGIAGEVAEREDPRD